MKPSRLAFEIALLAGAFAMSAAQAQQSRDTRPIAGSTTRDWAVEVVTEDLNYPWDIVRSGDRLILTEAAAKIVMIERGELRRYTVQTSDAIANEGGGGLLGIALAPDFTSSGIAYLYHTYRAGSALSNKVIQARFDGRSWSETRVLLAGIPGHRLYNGGRIAIGPDGHLFVTTGWTENRQRPQDLGNLAGKILRMTLDGQVPSDNPFSGSYIYSYGHRNPQGLAWNDAGELFVAEHGQSARDEINLIRPGANYGWPVISGDESRSGMETAWLNSGGDTWAPSGLAFASGEMLVAGLGERALLVYDSGAKALKPIFSSGDRFRQVLPVGGDLYVITTNRSPRAEGPSRDRLLKLSRRR